MIIRIPGEGQFSIDDATVDALNTVDAQLSAAVERGDQTAFTQQLAALTRLVREQGQPLADDSLTQSDVVLPAQTTTVVEVAALLAADGLIPG